MNNTELFYKTKKISGNMIFMVVVALMVVLLLFPIVAMISVSLKEGTSVFTTPVKWIPEKFVWYNYIEVFMKMDVLTGFKNSILVTAGSIVAILVIGIPAAYALSKLDFYGKIATYGIVLASQMFAPIIVVIPLYQMLNHWGWIDSYIGLIAMNTTFNLAFIVLMLTSHFDNVPKETMEAAIIDGCNKFRTLVKIVLPISSMGIVVAIIFIFTRTWNEFLFAFTFTSRSNMKTIIVKLYEILKNNPAVGIPWHLVMAGAVITTIPLIILFVSIRNYITGDATKGAIK
ncbi:MAG: carbohydrate ABC transporter permease [Clostridia bacterium]|nr:carbohydrate ABC transporter permease [Clostridia bacterium]